jgi:S1-C subfamily serine protease
VTQSACPACGGVDIRHGSTGVRIARVVPRSAGTATNTAAPSSPTRPAPSSLGPSSPPDSPGGGWGRRWLPLMAIVGAVVLVTVIAGTNGDSAVVGDRDPAPTTAVSTSVAVDVTEQAVTPTSGDIPVTTDSVPTSVVPSGPVGSVPSRSVVQLRVGNASENCWTGSAVVYPTADYLVTNHHVAVGDEPCPRATIEVWVSTDDARSVTLEYTAEVIVADEVSDVALLRIRPVSASARPLIAVEPTSDGSIGSEVRLYGFPSLGGDTLTVSRGIVSGFQREYGSDWIKTDASAAGGSSGGPALDTELSLVGVVSRFIVSVRDDGCFTGANVRPGECVPLVETLNLLVPLQLIDELIAGSGV